MSQETNWLRQRVEEFDASVQQARWHMGEVGEYRADLSPLWNDQCAAGIAQRYLDPWTGESGASLEALRAQTGALRLGVDALDEAERCAEQADQLSGEMHRLAAELYTILHGLDSVIQEAMDRAGESSARTQDCHALLAQANAAGHAA